MNDGAVDTGATAGDNPLTADAAAVPARLAWLADWLTAPAELCVLLMMLHIMADIVVRALFNISPEGTVESVTHWYMAIVAFLPVAALEARSGHLRVNILTERVSSTVARLLFIFARLATVAVCGFMAWLTAQQAAQATSLREYVELTHWSLPVWPVRWVFPLGFAAMALVALLALPALLRGLDRGRPQGDGR